MPPVRGNLSPARGRPLLPSQPRGMEPRGLVPGGHSGGDIGACCPPRGRQLAQEWGVLPQNRQSLPGLGRAPKCPGQMRTWLLPYLAVKKNVQGLAARTGVISTAQLGTGTSLSHGNLPALGGVIKRLAPFLCRLRVSPQRRAPQASCWHRAASPGTAGGGIALGTPRGAAPVQFGVKSGQFGPMEERNYPQTIALG